MIEKTITTSYYCTKCDQQYDEEDKDAGKVCMVCINHPELEGCEDCMYKCDEEKEGNYAGIEGCGRVFCDDCTQSTPFDARYPMILCMDCVKKHGIEKYYGESGREMYDKIEKIREDGKKSSIPEEDIERLVEL